MGNELYKFTTTMEDYTLKVEASPQTEAISQLYAEISSNIDKELIRNMPEKATMVLLRALLEKCIVSPTFESEELRMASRELLEKSVLEKY